MAASKPLNFGKLWIGMILFLFLLSGFRIAWVQYHQAPDDHPQAQNGLLDLSEWAMSERQTASLDGEWLFYPNKFIDPNAHAHLASELIRAPGPWSHVSKGSKPIHFGSYLLTIQLPNNHSDNQLYGIHIKDIPAARVYQNEQLLMQIGVPAKTADQYESRTGKYKEFFKPESNRVELVIHVANFENTVDGGMLESITFGTAKAIDRQVSFSHLMQWIVVGILLTHSLYAFVLYAMGRNRQPELLYFGGVLLFASLSILVDDDKILLSLLPINVEWSLKWLYLTFAGTVFFILKFNQSVFQLKGALLRGLLFTYTIASAALLILPNSFVNAVGALIMLMNLFSYSYIFIIVLKQLKSGNRDAIFIFVSNIVNLYNVLWGVAINLRLTQIPYYPFDYLIGIFAFAGFLFKRHLRIVQLNEKQTKELQQADKIKDQFLANTSHELRNPLHGIMNITQTILRDKQEHLHPKTKNNLQLLLLISQHMTLTLNDLLDISRLDEKQIKLRKQNIYLPAVTTGVIDMIRFMNLEKNIALTVAIPKSFPKVNADEHRLIQILFNLLHNAIKYTKEGSITVQATHDRRLATISVIDTGRGINEHTIQHLFERYKQAENATSPNEGGIGLGLHICKELVELHGGTISIESKVGEGSTFRFTLPLADFVGDERIDYNEVAVTLENEPTVAFSSPTPDQTDALGNQPSILIVDDDPVNLQVIKQVLEADYEVVTAQSGQSALAWIKKRDFDLVISDVMMPNMSGYELTQIIRRQWTAFELPILLLTARNQTEDINAGFQSGANDYVAKPLDALELRARVNALTELKKSVDEQLRLEAAWLQAQIQPHFLFNTLNTIASLSEIDITRMTKLLHEFGNYLRRSFDIQNLRSRVSLQAELELIESYLYIEKERFGDRLRIEWKVPEGLDFQLPPLSIQPLVENAVRHGVLQRIRGGTIEINVNEAETFYLITVTDDGVGISPTKVQELLAKQPHESPSLGITNTHHRLIKQYGMGLEITSKPDHGTTVRFQIPRD
ncbi:hypothetical protein BEP19_02945 [Ammoniphilus oxalaticus]|uniref:histidine kinase n=1 Tax=Ammoniphilus oxalaticus TaxID=66863 RepID=A0A419SNW1_9BACL|nr:ATP-binding protein [Ammoniphilus oxalaticus]RKD25901.1 hypothetical protein BEP19_02945 [Ammoniphilus oxalaticus]